MRGCITVAHICLRMDPPIAVGVLASDLFWLVFWRLRLAAPSTASKKTQFVAVDVLASPVFVKNAPPMPNTGPTPVFEKYRCWVLVQNAPPMPNTYDFVKSVFEEWCLRVFTKIKTSEESNIEDNNANCDEWLKSSFHNDDKEIKKEDPEIIEAKQVENLSATCDSTGLDVIDPIVSYQEISPRCNDKSGNSAEKQNDNATNLRENTPSLALDQVLSLLKQVAQEVQAGQEGSGRNHGTSQASVCDMDEPRSGVPQYQFRYYDLVLYSNAIVIPDINKLCAFQILQQRRRGLNKFLR